MKLALGTVQFGLDYGVANQGGKVTIEEVKNILDFSRDKGIDTLDTASRYGNSEQVLGEVGIDGCKIITKTTSLKNGVNEVIRDFYQSLEDLNQDSVDGLLIHDVSEVNDKEFYNLFERLHVLKRQGVVNKIGFSVYMPEQVDFLLGNFDFDLIQVPFNVFDTRLISGGQLQELKKRGVEVHARSVFLQGLLLNFNDLPDYFLAWQGRFREYQIMVKNNGLSLLEYALNFALNTPELDKVLVGVNSVNQLSSIVSSAGLNDSLPAFNINDVNLLNPSLWRKNEE